MERRIGHSTARERWSKKGRISLIPVLIWGMLFAAGERPAQAADAEDEVSDWEELVAAFADSANGTIIRLSENITQPNGSLVVPIGKELTLDLAGKELSITATNDPAIKVEGGETSLIIEDLSDEETGKLTVRSSNRPGIGGGYQGSGGGVKNGTVGKITIAGGKVTATGGWDSAGIGGSASSDYNGTITIAGGEITATGGDWGAGIGGGSYGLFGKVTITGGIVTAQGGSQASGIGGGSGGRIDEVTITGGTVRAQGGLGAPGIGSGINRSAGSIIITGGSVIPSSGRADISVIGAGCCTLDVSYVLDNTGTGTITIPKGQQLIVPASATVTNAGTINGEGRITGEGAIDNADGFIAVEVDGPNVSGNKFTLHLDLNDGSGSSLPMTVYAPLSVNDLTLQDAGAALPEPTRAAHRFEGWYTELDGGTKFTETDPLDDGRTLYARWQEIRVLLSSTASDPTNGVFTVTATFNEDVADFTQADINMTNGEVGSFSASAENGKVYTFDVTPTADGPVTVEVSPAVAMDAAGSGNAAALTLTYDGTAPTLELSTLAGEATNSAFTVTATFSEEVTGFAEDDIRVTNGDIDDFSASADNGKLYTFDVKPTADGPVTVEVEPGAAADAAGNANAGTSTLTLTYDTTAPLVEVDPAGSAAPARRAEPVATVTDAGGLAELVYAWTSGETAPPLGGPEWRPFASGAELAQIGGEGDWYVHVYAADKAGNDIFASFGPYTLDNTPPIIVLNGENPYYIPAGQTYVEPGAEATDNNDGSLSADEIEITGDVDTNRLGVYEVRYATSDRAGNGASATRSVYVYDGDSPVIRLLGEEPLVIGVGSEFDDPGAIAEDAQDGVITSAITVTGAVYTDTVGTYELIYRVTDSAGNAAPEARRTVHVIAPPVVALNGLAEVAIRQGSAWSDPGATATDAYYGDLNELMTVSGTVDSRTPGVYTLRYAVENPIGQSAEAVRTVTVARPPANPSSGSGGGGGGESQDRQDGESGPATPNAVNLILNGLAVQADATLETTDDGRTLARLRLTAEQMGELFASSPDTTAAMSGTGEVFILGHPAGALPEARVQRQEVGLGAVKDAAVIEVSGIGDIVAFELPAAALREVWRARPEAALQVIVDGNGMRLPLQAVADAAANATIALTVGRASAADSEAVRGAIDGLGAKELTERPIVYKAEADGRALKGWNGAYQERTMTLDAAADPLQATAVWIDERYRIHFVPSVFANGGRTVTMPSRQDGLYAVIRSERTFVDIAEHWAKADIERMANKRIVEGREAGEFAPSDPVTRAEFAALLVRALGLPEREGRSFADVPETGWYASAVGTASEAGLIGGYEDGSFRPQERITREQMAVMIDRALAYAGQAAQADEAVPGAFADEAEIAEWAKKSVELLTGTGIIQGLTATEFAPREGASRAQSAVILNRLLQHLGFVNR
ncbi:immunoglobulin-like domain-containing protein [Cohnella cellulosilytica]|uniref:Immunoglobulin-like domain-containing protein n=1 Tax=Cohnella cellulosilytica TaxID=986710 RepID=A0ABW2F9Z9_9BACL